MLTSRCIFNERKVSYARIEEIMNEFLSTHKCFISSIETRVYFSKFNQIKTTYNIRIYWLERVFSDSYPTLARRFLSLAKFPRNT